MPRSLDVTRQVKLLFFLGGYDLEMVTIRDLLEEQQAVFHDGHLTWGAKASAYRDEIRAAIDRGATPVLIELDNDLDLPTSPATDLLTQHSGPPTRHSLLPPCLLVDHHGARAGADRPTSLHQVFSLLGLPPERWTRHFDLVAANDRGHIRAMLALRPPATRDELIAIRAADRAAQGVRPEDEAAAREAVARRETVASGALTILRLTAQHTSPAADLMEPALGGPGHQNLLVLSPREVNFFGAGPLVQQLNERFPGGWYGGNLPERGFWGHQTASKSEVLSWLREQLGSG